MKQELSERLSIMEFNRFGLICAILLIVGCAGGVAVGLGAVLYLPTLILITLSTMTTIALVISVSPMKWIMTSAIVSIIIDILLIILFAFL